MAIERDELDAELASLERQRTETVRQRDEAAGMVVRIEGAIRAVRHLIDKDARKVIAAKQETDAEAQDRPATE